MYRSILVAASMFTSLPAYASPIAVSTEPAIPLVELTRTGQALNFDLLLVNSGAKTLEVEMLELSLRDATGQLVMQQRVGQNGNTIEVIPNRSVPAKSRLLIFNPLWHWPSDVSLDRLEITIRLSSEEGASEILKHAVRTRVRAAIQTLNLPLDGNVFVHAGHTFTSHHRRFPLHSAMTDALQIEHNATRYAYDFAVVDAKGEMYRGEGKDLSDWFGYGAPVFAPTSGTVVEVHDGQPDNEIDKPPRLDREIVLKKPKLLYGNYVLIDHGSGELSMLAHLKPGSIEVKVGDKVEVNRRLARVGMSGDASIVHLHYQMQSGRGFDEGIPVRFKTFSRKLGEHWVEVDTGPIEEGEVLRDGIRP